MSLSFVPYIDEDITQSDIAQNSKVNKEAAADLTLPPLTHLLSNGQIWVGDGTASERSHATSWMVSSKQSTRSRRVISFNVPELDSSLLHGGLVCGGTHEFFYNDPLFAARLRGEQNLLFPSTIPALLARNAIESYYSSPASAWDRSTVHTQHSSIFPFFIVWIGKRCWPTPFALPADALRSCLFIDPPTKKLTLWGIETALRSHAVKLVIADCPSHSLTTSRRLLLAAEAHDTTAILLRNPKEISASSSATTKWQLSPAPSDHSQPLWELALTRCKGGAVAATTWLLGLEDSDENGAEVSLRVFPRMVDRGHQAQATNSYQYGT
jgi:hypothetical protein